jgi:demethylmenaquinone methyltransferase / 2-methoxy-6-polyprenyl-1,4-benzoquinol methylase
MTQPAEQLFPSSPRKAQALDLFAKLPHEYDEMGWLLSFGQDRRWRRAMVSQIQASPADRILDVATGTGLVAAELVRRYRCSVVGVDQSEDMLGRARRRLAGEPHLAKHVELVTGEAERLPFADGEFDGLTVGYLFRYVDDPAVAMRELGRVVKPGGIVASFEFGVPSWRPAHAFWKLYTRYVMPGAGRLVSRGWYDVSRFLSYSIPEYYERYPIAHQCDFWHDAGIRSVNVRRMSFGAGVVMWGTRRTDGSATG